MSPVHGLRPSPLRISKDSHVIQKSSSSSSSSSLNQHQVPMMNKQQQQREPVIIYTHSPQIIHTNPRDFMSLVQKLTGCSATRTTTTTTSDVDDDRTNNKTEGGFGGGHHQSDREKQNNIIIRRNSTRDHRDDEKFKGEINYNEGLMKPFLAEIPLFTPNSTNLFFSPKGLLRNPDDQSMVPSSSSPGIAGSLSPSFMEFLNMKELPEY